MTNKLIIDAYQREITLNCLSADEFEIRLYNNITLSLANTHVNKEISIWFIQDSTGGKTVTFSNQFTFTNLNKNTLLSDPLSVTLLEFDMNNGTIYCTTNNTSTGGAGSTSVTAFDFLPENPLLFDKNYESNLYNVGSAFNVTKDLTGAITNNGNILNFKADGNVLHIPTFVGITQRMGETDEFDTTENIVNQIAVVNIGPSSDPQIIYSYVNTYTYTGPVTLSAPGSFAASATSVSQINLSWTVVANASSYKLEYSLNGSSNWIQIGGTISQATSSYNHTGLSTNTTYYYRISSIGDGVNYFDSTYATINTTTNNSVTLSAPTVTGSALGQTSLRFSWSNITNNSGYEIKISTDNGSTFGVPISIATNTTSYDITGLSMGTRRDVQVRTLGDGSNYITSAYSITAYSTTTNIVQLSTPTLNTPSIVSSTELDLTWLTVSNVTSWKLEWSANGTTGWTQIGGTLAAGTLSYNHTSLTAGTAYYYRLTAIGDGVNYSDSSVSATVNATTKTAAPTLVSSATSVDGLTITHTFSRAMAASPTTSGYSTSPVKTISSATRNADTTKIDVVVSVAFANADTITATIPQWSPNDGGDNFAGVSNTSVTNNVPAAGDFYRLNSYGTEYFVYDSKDAANFTLSGTDINVIKDGSGNNRNMSYSTGTKFIYNSVNKRIEPNTTGYYPLSDLNLGTVGSYIMTFNTLGSTTTYNNLFGSGGSYSACLISGSTLRFLINGSQNQGAMGSIATGIHTIIVTRNGTALNYYLDGVLKASPTANTSDYYWQGFGNNTVNYIYNSGYIYYQGAVNSVLNQTQVTAISNALNARY